MERKKHKTIVMKRCYLMESNKWSMSLRKLMNKLKTLRSISMTLTRLAMLCQTPMRGIKPFSRNDLAMTTSSKGSLMLSRF